MNLDILRAYRTNSKKDLGSVLQFFEIPINSTSVEVEKLKMLGFTPPADLMEFWSTIGYGFFCNTLAEDQPEAQFNNLLLYPRAVREIMDGTDQDFLTKFQIERMKGKFVPIFQCVDSLMIGWNVGEENGSLYTNLDSRKENPIAKTFSDFVDKLLVDPTFYMKN